jgi:protein involved in polysaccharide export with SLBB domain
MKRNMMFNRNHHGRVTKVFLAVALAGVLWPAHAADLNQIASPGRSAGPAATNVIQPSAIAPAPAPSSPSFSDTRSYRLTANDVLKIKVYQEEDLTTDLRIGKDGTATFPLLGAISLGGKSIEEATGMVRELLAKDYLVNPQVTITVTEYAKRRFTVLGQVGKPGIYEFPNEEGVTLLQAIGMAGGFTRLAKTSTVTVTRTSGGNRTITVNVKANTNDPATKQFEVLPDDTVQVGERTF